VSIEGLRIPQVDRVVLMTSLTEQRLLHLTDKGQYDYSGSQPPLTHIALSVHELLLGKLSS
jgi:hypothetical protein